MNSSIPITSSFYLEIRIYKQYCMTPSKQSSKKRHSGVLSILIRCIDTGCLWCALKALTKNIIERKEYVHFNQQSRLTSRIFWQLITSVSLPLFEVFQGDVFFRPSAHANSKGRGSRTTYKNFVPSIAILKKEDHCIGNICWSRIRV